MGGPTGHLATIQPLRCQGETRQRYASSGPQGARQRRPQVSDTPTIRLAGIHPCPAAGPARQPGDCPLCPREEIVSTDFEEKILLIFVTRGNSSPHITGQTSWRLRRKGGLGKKTQIKREEDELEDLLLVGEEEEEERCIRVNLSQSADLCDYQDTCTLFASKHLRGD